MTDEFSQETTQTENAKGRVVAIVGRPNVGKSAVFNRIAGKRIAIVHEEAGVTRDRLMREVLWDNDRFALIDTGGIMNIDNERIHDRIDAGIRMQAEAALKDAAVVVFVVDIQAGISPMDEEVAGILHKSGIPVFVAANKADTSQFDESAADFAVFGLPVFPISALHGRGFNMLMDEVVARLPKDDARLENEAEGAADKPLCVAIVGRPNAGKSSFINKLLRAERVIVSDIPGTTRDSIDVPFSIQGRSYTLIDTAGARREARVDTAVERYSRYRMQESIGRADIVVLMIDATRGVGLLDKQLASEIGEQGKGCVIVVNKWDLAESNEKEYGEKLAHDLAFMAYCPVVYMSAETGYNVNRVLGTIEHVAAQCQAVLPTGVLNRVVAESYETVGVPSKNGRQLKLYYAVQVSRNPIIVRIFINDPRRLPGHYKAYIVNSLRRHFGLEGAVVMLQFRGREKSATRGDSATRSPKTKSQRSAKPKKNAPPKNAAPRPKRAPKTAAAKDALTRPKRAKKK